MTRPARPTVLVAILCLAVGRVLALSAFPGSPCYNTCQGDQPTSSGDIVCLDEDWSNSTKGQLLQSCVSCLQSSNHQSGPVSDATLFLYYTAIVQQTCLSGEPGAPISNCASKCGDLPSAFVSVSGQAFFASPWAYCTASNNAYKIEGPGCALCLQSQPHTVLLGNFVHVGNVGCDTRPDIGNGVSVYPNNDLFNANVLGSGSTGNRNSTSSASASKATGGATSTSSSSTASRTATPSSTKPTTAVSSHPDGSNGGSKGSSSAGTGSLSTGAAAGIGIVVGLLGVAAIVLLAIFARRRMVQRGSGAGADSGAWQKMRDSPQPPMRQAGRATPPAAGVFVPPPGPAAAGPSAASLTGKRSKSFKSIRSIASRSTKNLTPRTSEWFYAANPKKSTDLSALPQRGWD